MQLNSSSVLIVVDHLECHQFMFIHITVHLCNVYGDSDVHQALHLFPEEGSFCIFSLTFSSDNREILGG